MKSKESENPKDRELTDKDEVAQLMLEVEQIIEDIKNGKIEGEYFEF